LNKWRFATIDLELSLQPNGWSDCNSNGLEHAMANGADNPFIRPWWQSMSNPEYRKYFINRYADVLNSTYKIERLLDVENNFFNIWTPEMPNEYQRWGDPWNVGGWMQDYYNRHLQLRDELQCKTENIRGQVQSILGLGNSRSVTLKIVPAMAGEILLNTLNVADSNWTGMYYEDVDIDMAAQAQPGYLFSHWGVNNVIGDTLNPFWNGFINEDSLVFTAYFIEDTTEINTVNNFENLHVLLYPNPANESVNIICESVNNTIQVYNVLGQEIERKSNLGNQTHIDVKNWNNGMYYVVIQDKQTGMKKTIPFVKE